MKNKFAPPFRSAEFDIIYGEGISREGDLLDLGVAHRVVDKAGSWYSYGDLRLGDTRGRVVTNSQEPIPGLYAAGEMVGGLFYHNYPGGSGLSAGMVFGRLAGTSAGQDAAALKSK